jgi:hypothetical protein
MLSTIYAVSAVLPTYFAHDRTALSISIYVSSKAFLIPSIVASKIEFIQMQEYMSFTLEEHHLIRLFQKRERGPL